MAEKNSQKIPGLDRLEDELFINNDSSSIDSTDIDDEFDRLLNEFINNELKDVETPEPKPAAPQTKPQPSKAKNQAPAISEKTSDRQFHKLAPDEEAVSYFELPQSPRDIAPAPAMPSEPPLLSETDRLVASLCDEERALYNAYNNFVNAINMMCEPANMPIPDFSLIPEQLIPRYKPRLAEQIKDEALAGWSIMLQLYPGQLDNLNPNAADDDLLSFAEKTPDELLQLALISYVEILIEMESCDIAYESRRIRAKKKRIERQVIEEHEARRQKIKNYIEKIERKKFPINAERLVVNYFKTARKDPDGAYQILVNNPATYAPIDTDKIPDRFFGLIKSKPEDGIKINRQIGNYMKKLKA